MSTTELEHLINRLENVALKLEKIADITTADMSSQEAPSVTLYNQIMHGSFKNFLTYSDKIGGELKIQSQMVGPAFASLRQILDLASKSQAPKPDELQNIFKPISDSIQSIQAFREKNRGSKLINHLSAVSEAIPALGWVAVSPTPAPYIKDMIEAGQFYTNRVLMEYKDKDETHCNWARCWIQTLSELQSYVKENHTTGLKWNPKGSVASTGGVTSCGPPPPPPPPPMDIYSAGEATQDDPRAALFKEINKGEGITHSLRRVDAAEQTHKNPALRCQGPSPYKAPSAAPSKGFQPVAAVKPPKFELEGKKWKIEYQTDNKNLVVSETEMNQGVHVFQCKNCHLIVKGKVNSIVLDSCKKTSVVFDDIVSCVEFINCQSMQAQSMGKVPTVSIDKTDGVQLFLSKSSLNCEIVTAKASEINISVPTDDGDFVEHPVPEQFKTMLVGRTLKTIPVDKA